MRMGGTETGTGTINFATGRKKGKKKGMPRLARGVLERGYFHVMNRGNHRQDLFHRREEFGEFLELISEAPRDDLDMEAL